MGFYDQSVIISEGIAVEHTRIRPPLGSSIHEWLDGGEWLADEIEGMTGLEVSYYVGCSGGDTFSLSHACAD